MTLTIELTMAEQLAADLAVQLQAITQISAVSVKLPEFWVKSPEVWFARVEAQFGTKGISQDQTMYDYVVSALDINTAEEVQAILINPPITNRYMLLKKSLIATFGKSQTQKDMELLNLNGLGDKRPTALLRRINALNDDPQTLKRALFLLNLPADIRSILAGHDARDTEALAEAADRIWETRAATVQQVYVVPADTHGFTSMESPVNKSTTVEAVLPASKPWRLARSSQRDLPVSTTSSAVSTPSICFYHLTFGPDARRCRPGCKFASLLSKRGSSSPGNATAGR